MGGGGSKPEPGAHDKLLAEFSGTAAIDISDPFWSKLLHFPAPLTQLPPADVEAALTYHCEELGADTLLLLALLCLSRRSLAGYIKVDAFRGGERKALFCSLTCVYAIGL